MFRKNAKKVNDQSIRLLLIQTGLAGTVPVASVEPSRVLLQVRLPPALAMVTCIAHEGHQKAITGREGTAPELSPWYVAVSRGARR